MSESKLQLLTPFKMGDLTLQNRVVLAPLTRARCGPNKDPFHIENSLPNELHQLYYEQRATGGLIITEATAISVEGSGWQYAPFITTKSHVDAWKKVVDRVHKKGGKIFLQLWHMGRQSHSSFHPDTKDIVSASDIAIGPSAKAKTIAGEYAPFEKPRALTVEQIKQTVLDYENASKNAKAAGFDGVEIHGANGYLIDQFLQSSSNVRTDNYGGSFTNRMRFLVEVTEACMKVFPANRIGIRLSPNGNYGGMGAKDNNELFPFVASKLEKYGLAYLHIMDGLGFGYHNKCPIVTVADIRRVFSGPIIANVGLTRDIAEGMLRSGATDLACFGRLYMSNPDLPERFANNWPLAAEPPYEYWWKTPGAKGYTDYPFYKAEAKETKEEKK